MGEDRSRIRTNPGICARLRSFGFNILMVSKTGTIRKLKSQLRENSPKDYIQ